jgi:hypothetical protein
MHLTAYIESCCDQPRSTKPPRVLYVLDRGDLRAWSYISETRANARQSLYQ